MRRPHNFMHGLTDTPTHKSWMRMIARCEDTRNNRYSRYGARGIKVCARWRESFQAFLADMGTKPTSSHSIDRIDNDGDYSPGNCRWSTPLEQMRNYSRNRTLTAFGETKVIVDWLEDPRCKASRGALYARLKRPGWTPEDIISRSRYGIRHEHGPRQRRRA